MALSEKDIYSGSFGGNNREMESFIGTMLTLSRPANMLAQWLFDWCRNSRTLVNERCGRSNHDQRTGEWTGPSRAFELCMCLHSALVWCERSQWHRSFQLQCSNDLASTSLLPTRTRAISDMFPEFVEVFALCLYSETESLPPPLCCRVYHHKF